MTPDAVKIPASLVAGIPEDPDRKARVVELAEELLEIDLSSDVEAHAREQQGFYFATTSPSDLMQHPVGSPREGQSRYRWERRPDGIELGYLDE